MSIINCYLKISTTLDHIIKVETAKNKGKESAKKIQEFDVNNENRAINRA